MSSFFGYKKQALRWVCFDKRGIYPLWVKRICHLSTLCVPRLKYFVIIKKLTVLQLEILTFKKCLQLFQIIQKQEFLTFEEVLRISRKLKVKRIKISALLKMWMYLIFDNFLTFLFYWNNISTTDTILKSINTEVELCQLNKPITPNINIVSVAAFKSLDIEVTQN